MTDVVLHALGESVTVGTAARWLMPDSVRAEAYKGAGWGAKRMKLDTKITSSSDGLRHVVSAALYNAADLDSYLHRNSRSAFAICRQGRSSHNKSSLLRRQRI
jgi:hypothetical protein